MYTVKVIASEIERNLTISDQIIIKVDNPETSTSNVENMTTLSSIDSATEISLMVTSYINGMLFVHFLFVILIIKKKKKGK